MVLDGFGKRKTKPNKADFTALSNTKGVGRQKRASGPNSGSLWNLCVENHHIGKRAHLNWKIPPLARKIVNMDYQRWSNDLANVLLL